MIVLFNVTSYIMMTQIMNKYNILGISVKNYYKTVHIVHHDLMVLARFTSRNLHRTLQRVNILKCRTHILFCFRTLIAFCFTMFCIQTGNSMRTNVFYNFRKTILRPFTDPHKRALPSRAPPSSSSSGPCTSRVQRPVCRSSFLWTLISHRPERGREVFVLIY